MKRILFVVTFFACVCPSWGQKDGINLFELSLEDLLSIEVSVTTKKATGIRETPGIVSLITEEDIRNSGSRDLTEMLQLLVPGFAFGVDVEGVVGIGVRGLWAHEGKVLVMLDGQEMNDGMFATVPFGNHFPLDNIERVEIVRGPGSAIYGGYAGVAVINIITKTPNKTGGSASYMASHTGKSFSHSNLSYGANYVKDDLKIRLAGTYGKGSRSDRDFTDYYGDSRSMSGASELNVTNANLLLNYKKFNFLTILDNYHLTQIDLWDALYPNKPLDQRFNSYFAQAKYDFDLGTKITLAPKLNYKWQKPWNLNVYDENIGEYTNNKEFNRVTAGLTGTFTEGNFNLISGVEYTYDALVMPSVVHEYEETFNNGKNELTYSNLALYGQGVLETFFANITLGARYDKTSEYGGAFVPRIGLTKAFNKFHVKAMASQSFRVPGGILPNRIPVGNPAITPEKGTNFEFELGYRLPFNTWIVVNGFDVSFDKVIIYNAEGSLGYYTNSGKIGTRGVEAEVKHVSEKWLANFNIAYYQRKKSDTDNSFSVPVNENLFLGFSPIRVNGLITYKLTRNISISPSVSFFGEKYAYTSFDEVNDVDVLTKLDPITLINLNVRFKDLFTKGFTLEVGAHNILNKPFVLAQPYAGSHAPLPAMDRSFKVRMAYSF
jgi:outer membrane receptor protein involved in Fe transport